MPKPKPVKYRGTSIQAHHNILVRDGVSECRHLLDGYPWELVRVEDDGVETVLARSPTVLGVLRTRRALGPDVSLIVRKRDK